VTAAAEAGTWTPERTAFGRVMPSRDATLSAPFAATVTQLAVEPGQQVEDGQVLARLEAPPLAVLVGKLQAARRAADLTEQRLAGLQQREKASLATKDDVLQGEIAANEARSALDEAWQALAETLVALGQKPDRAAITDRPGNAADALTRGLAEVRAPFAGTVAAVPASAGATLAGGAPLVRVQDLSQAVVEVGVPAEALDEWRQGTASAATPAGPVALLSNGAGPRLDPGTGLWLLRYVAEGAQGRLRDGEWVKVTVHGQARAAVWVPEAAVVARDGRTWCVLRDGEATRAVAVTAGPAEGGRVPVLDGLGAGQRVVTAGAYELLYRDLNRLLTFED
jgi:multidrug efflux pump subunit AcrA (membrane-fusion protein)